MARVPIKNASDQNPDFQGFLNDLQDWELSLKDKEKKLNSHVSSESKSNTGLFGEDRKPAGKTGTVDSLKYGARRHISNSVTIEECSPDATSEKELGNEYFKQKKYKEAIECYSRSIAFSPTTVAYANRAMANLKLRRFQNAEDDCTEALNLDDRYIKAYSRRATARKELGKLKESIEDSEFALRLEPHNQEIKKQYAETKSLYEKEIIQKASGALRRSVQGMQKVDKSEMKGDIHSLHSVSSSTERKPMVAFEGDKANDKLVPVRASMNEIESKGIQADGFHENNSRSSSLESAKRKTGKQKLKASVQELASRAASKAMAEAARNIKPPSSAYEFEVSWHGLSGNRRLQADLLKVTAPSALPQIFRISLSASILIDIVKCISTFFTEEMDLAVQYLEHLTKIPRFDMLIMFLSSTDKADLLKIWNEVFLNEATTMEYAEILDNLRNKYCLKQ